MNEYRIVSLLPSATEIVCALGFRPQLVGRSHECDFPASVTTLRVCTRPKFKVEGGSMEIHQRVEHVIKNALSVYEVDTKALQELNPTHIVTQSQCDVCAVSLKDVEEAVCELTGSQPSIVSLLPESLEHIWKDIQRVGNALSATEEAENLVTMCKRRMTEITDRAAKSKRRPTVGTIEWMEPLMAAGNWMPELISMAGGTNIFGEAGKHSPWIRWEDLAMQNPDILLVSPCGFPIDRTLSEISILKNRPEWNRLRAAKDGHVYVADGNQFFNRPGPRVVESLEILAEILHPDEFHAKHEGGGWIRLD